MALKYEIDKKIGKSRLGRLITKHGVVNTPAFMPVGTLGNTWYGTTPEEADLMAGNKDADVEIVNTGVAILNKKESLPVNIITSVSQIVLPSFERMGDVFVLKVVK